MTVGEIKKILADYKPKSKWAQGVREYAIDILSYFDDNEDIQSAQQLLNGAENWAEYSDGGCALIYDCDIAERLCTPSELKRKRGGDLEPNRNESWLDVQVRALRQAERLIMKINDGFIIIHS